MVQYLPDDYGIVNAGNDVHGRTNAVGAWMRRNGNPGRTTADSAGFHVNVEHPLEPLCPAHCHMRLYGCFLILIRRHLAAALAPLGRGHPQPVFAVRSEDTMVSSQVHSGFGYQGGQRFSVCHEWRPGDLLMWKNRAVLHRRDAFDPDSRCLMHRTQIKGDATIT